jgi:hypothetical protein
MDPFTNMSDYGFTQHSGCPVYEGEKRLSLNGKFCFVQFETTADGCHQQATNSVTYCTDFDSLLLLLQKGALWCGFKNNS